MVYQPNEFDRQVFAHVEHALGDHARDGSSYPDDKFVWEHFAEPRPSRDEVRASIHRMVPDYLNVKIRNDGPWTIHGIENSLP